jgi:hypothetical protein
MQRFLFVLSFLCFFSFTNAQDTLTVLYAKDSSSIIKLHNDLKIVYVFSDSEPYTTPEKLTVVLSVGKKTITVPTTTQTNSNKRTITLGEFPSKFLDIKLEGHLVFGKALLKALDTVGVDSTITVNTEVLSKNKVVTGPLYLDFKGGPGIYEPYWNEVEYYFLLEKQTIVQDSIIKLTADKQRAKALMEASNKYLETTATLVEGNQKELDKKHSQFNSKMESLKKINTRIDDSFEKAKVGKELTAEEKKQIAYLTTDASNIKKELQKQPNGSEALVLFEKMSRAMTQNRAAKKQYDNAAQVLQSRTERLKDFTLKGEQIEKRLRVLKKTLKL